MRDYDCSFSKYLASTIRFFSPGQLLLPCSPSEPDSLIKWCIARLLHQVETNSCNKDISAVIDALSQHRCPWYCHQSHLGGVVLSIYMDIGSETWLNPDDLVGSVLGGLLISSLEIYAYIYPFWLASQFHVLQIAGQLGHDQSRAGEGDCKVSETETHQ